MRMVGGRRKAFTSCGCTLASHFSQQSMFSTENLLQLLRTRLSVVLDLLKAFTVNQNLFNSRLMLSSTINSFHLPIGEKLFDSNSHVIKERDREKDHPVL